MTPRRQAETVVHRLASNLRRTHEDIDMLTNIERAGITAIDENELEAIGEHIGGGWNICEFVLASALGQTVLGNCMEAYAEGTGLTAFAKGVGTGLAALTNVAFDAVMNSGEDIAQANELGWDYILGEAYEKTLNEIVTNIQNNVYGAFG
jgi:hypothetical protein